MCVEIVLYENLLVEKKLKTLKTEWKLLSPWIWVCAKIFSSSFENRTIKCKIKIKMFKAGFKNIFIYSI